MHAAGNLFIDPQVTLSPDRPSNEGFPWAIFELEFFADRLSSEGFPWLLFTSSDAVSTKRRKACKQLACSHFSRHRACVKSVEVIRGQECCCVCRISLLNNISDDKFTSECDGCLCWCDGPVDYFSGTCTCVLGRVCSSLQYWMFIKLGFNYSYATVHLLPWNILE